MLQMQLVALEKFQKTKQEKKELVVKFLASPFKNTEVKKYCQLVLPDSPMPIF